MRLHLLGTTGYHPSDERHTACFMLPESGVVLDAGTAMYRIRQHLQTDTLDIFLTHAHLDHVAGLTFLLGILAGKGLRRVRVHGDPEKLEAIRSHLFSEFLFPAPPPFEFVPLEETVRLRCGGVLSHFPLEHPGGSLGYRIDWPERSLAYVTDTMADPDASYVERIRGVDLLVHECTFPDGWEDRAKLTGHSCPTPVAQVAAKAAVGKLVLVHMNPMLDPDDPIGMAVVRQIFPRAELGCDNTAVDF
jgi:ribonuclease Z